MKKQDDRRSYREAKRITKRNIWDRKCKEIKSFVDGRKAAILAFHKCTEKSEQKHSTIPINNWVAYYKDLMTETRPEFLTPSTPHIDIEVEKISVHVETVRQAVRMMKNGKSPGSGGIPAELIKLLQPVTNLINKCLNRYRVPKE